MQQEGGKIAQCLKKYTNELSVADKLQAPEAKEKIHDFANACKADAAPSEFHGLLGAGLFNYEKTVGESVRRTILLPIFVMTYQDWAYWSFGSGGVWLYQSDDRKMKVGVGVKAHRGYTEEEDPAYAGYEYASQFT